MNKINLLELIGDNWYIDVDKSLLNEIIEKSKEKLGSQLALSKYLKINNSTISRWQGIFNSLELSRKLNMSLIRTQVLLKKGFDKGMWIRNWNGIEFTYAKN